jgi:hypothetical protein
VQSSKSFTANGLLASKLWQSEAAAAGQPQDIDWLDRYANNLHNEMLAVHERAEARVAVEFSDGEDSGVQLTVSVATNIDF